MPAKRTAKKSGKQKRPQGKPPAKTGRPSDYTELMGEEICRRLYESDGESLPQSMREICRDELMPSRSTVHRWLTDFPEFRSQYAHARELRKDALTDRILWLSCEAKKHATGMPGTGEAGAKVAAYKIEIDTLKWILSKEYAREYGDKLTQEISGPDGKPIKSETSHTISEELEAKILERTMNAGRIAANVEPPASFRGNGGEE